MAQRYAENTTVSISDSQNEIERILARYGATGFLRGWDNEKAFLAFSADGRQVRFVLPMPSKSEFRYTAHRPRRLRSEEAVNTAWEQACRQRWRALALVVKAKLEAVQAGISTFEQEFLAHIMLPNGQLVGQWLQPQIAATYESGKMPPLLPEGR